MTTIYSGFLAKMSKNRGRKVQALARFFAVFIGDTRFWVG